MHDTASIVQVIIPVPTVQLAYRQIDVWWFEVICAYWERERERWFTHAVCEILSHRNLSNYFLSYLMEKYELCNIIIISPAPDSVRRWRYMSCRSRLARHLLEIIFLRSAFLKTQTGINPITYRSKKVPVLGTHP